MIDLAYLVSYTLGGIGLACFAIAYWDTFR